MNKALCSSFGILGAIIVGLSVDYLVVRPLPWPEPILDTLLRYARPVIECARKIDSAYGEIGVVGVIYTLPTIILSGVLLGVLAARSRYRRFMVYSVLCWPLYAFVIDMVRLSRLQNAGAIVGNSHLVDPFQRRMGAATVLYSLEFALLFVTIYLAYSAYKKITSHNSSLDSVTMRRSA